MKTIIWIVGVFVAGVAAIFLFSRGGAGLTPPLEVGEVHPLDYVKGNTSSSVVLVEYSDFQCPACRSYYSMMRQVAQEYGNRIAIVYRNFPLISIHFNAEFAARAAEAARKQGKFWEMHDLLFEKQDEWAEDADYMSHFESYATLLGISVDQFKADFDSEEVKNFIVAQRNHATKLGLKGTPTFFLNGKEINNPRTLSEFRSVIDSALETSAPTVYKDLIQVDKPGPNKKIASPVSVSGKARGNWYFEASFPVEVLDEDGTSLGMAVATAEGEWMTPDYVNFSGAIPFKQPKGQTGTIVFHKDNPSGLPENADKVSIPVAF